MQSCSSNACSHAAVTHHLKMQERGPQTRQETPDGGGVMTHKPVTQDGQVGQLAFIAQVELFSRMR
jgi:hypothetical protein